MQEKEFTGEIVALDKDRGTGRFRCKDGTEFTFAVGEGVAAQRTYDLFGQKNVCIGGLALAPLAT